MKVARSNKYCPANLARYRSRKVKSALDKGDYHAITLEDKVLYVRRI